MHEIYVLVFSACLNTSTGSACDVSVANYGTQEQPVNAFIRNEDCMRALRNLGSNPGLYKEITGKDIQSGKCEKVIIPDTNKE